MRSSVERAAEMKSSEYLAGLARFGWHLGLERIEGLLARVGSPDRALRCVHIAGTNGKGSTSACIANILAAAGYRVGLYTSPHLERYSERIVVQTGPTGPGVAGDASRREIPSTALLDLLIRLEPHVRALAETPEVGAPTEFEVLTAAALLHFVEKSVDIAVLETGLGGRLDATNVVTPEVSVVTHVALDHLDRLGCDLRAIAGEKAGIIKAGRPVVIAPQSAEALAVLQGAAAERGASYRLVTGEGAGATGVGEMACFSTRGLSRTGGVFDVWPDGRGGPVWRGLSTPLLGLHQITNSAVAAATAWELSLRGMAITEEAVRSGLAGVWWPGRGELVRRNPLALVDGAHNPDGMRNLVHLLDTLFSGVRRIGVVGFLGDKEYREMAALLGPRLSEAIVTAPHSGRAADLEAVRAAFAASGCPVRVIPEPGDAARIALREAGSDDLLVGCGSLYLIGDLRRGWGGENG